MKTSFKISDVCFESMTRQSGKILREHIIKVLKKNKFVSIDLENQDLTPSFADDAFGKLVSSIGMETFKKTIEINNVGTSSRSLIVHVVNRRSKEFLTNPSHHKEMTTV